METVLCYSSVVHLAALFVPVPVPVLVLVPVLVPERLAMSVWDQQICDLSSRLREAPFYPPTAKEGAGLEELKLYGWGILGVEVLNNQQSAIVRCLIVQRLGAAAVPAALPAAQ